MKSLFIAGNWKSNKTLFEAENWLNKFKTFSADTVKFEDKTIVICAPFTLLSLLKDKVKSLNLPLSLAAQNISPFDSGAYTGEVNAVQIKELADWVVIGHSERRKYFNETDELLQKKVDQSKSAGLKIIYCVPDDKSVVPQSVDVIAYEPVWAIGTGKADTPENAGSVISKIKANFQVKTIIYGGSVTPENVKSFTDMPSIDGVLPGGASLDAEKFWNLIAAT